MPKITRHGGASNESEESFHIPIQDVDITPNERDVLLTLGDEEIPIKVRKLPKEDESSVGNSYSTSSEPTQTIDELLKTNRP